MIRDARKQAKCECPASDSANIGYAELADTLHPIKSTGYIHTIKQTERGGHLGITACLQRQCIPGWASHSPFSTYKK